LGLLCLVSTTAEAGVIAGEDFEAYAIDTGLDGQSGGSGAWTGAWSAMENVTVISGGLTYANGQVAVNGGGRALQATFDPQEDITDGIYARGVPENTDTMYMSLLFRDTVNDEEDPATGELIDGSNDFIQWGLDDGTANPKTSVMRRNSTFQARSTTSAGNSGDSGIKSVVGNVAMLVYKAEKTAGGNYDNVSLFVNPDSLTEPSVADAVSNVDSGIASVANFVARSAFHEPGDTFVIDQITIGTAWTDVVVPEPSTLSLVLITGLCGLAGLGRQRRRS
jgi:hypothetical protein